MSNITAKVNMAKQELASPCALEPSTQNIPCRHIHVLNSIQKVKQPEQLHQKVWNSDRQMGPRGTVPSNPRPRDEWHVALQNPRHQVSNAKKHVSWHTTLESGHHHPVQSLCIFSYIGGMAVYLDACDLLHPGLSLGNNTLDHCM